MTQYLNRQAHPVLERMRARLANPTAWTKRYSARDAQGLPCDPYAPQARCWCLLGAANVEAGGNMALEGHIDDLLQRHTHDGLSVPGFNDDAHTTHADVLRLIDQAIQELRP